MQFVGGVTQCSLLGMSHNAVCWGCHTMQFVARNVAKVELDSDSATVACNVARKVLQCVRPLCFVHTKS